MQSYRRHIVIFIAVIIPIVMFAQSETQICSVNFRPQNHIWGRGEILRTSGMNNNQIKEQVKNRARDDYASSIITFVESESKSIDIEKDGNYSEYYEKISSFGTKYKMLGVKVVAVDCGGGIFRALAMKEEKRVYEDIETDNKAKKEKAEKYLESAKQNGSYEGKLRDLFLAFVHNRSQIPLVHAGKKLSEDIFSEINSEIVKISNSLRIEYTPINSLRFDADIDREIHIIIKTSQDSKPTLLLKAELRRGLINTAEGYWSEIRNASIPIENGEGIISITRAISSEDIEIHLEINLDEYNPDESIYNDLGYSKLNRIKPSKVFGNLFNKIGKTKRKITIQIKRRPAIPPKGIITINTPGFEESLIVKIDGKAKDRTKNAQYRSTPLGYSYYTIELESHPDSKVKIIPETRIVKLTEKNKRIDITGIKKMKSTIEFISANKDDKIKIHLKGIYRDFDGWFFYKGGIVRPTLNGDIAQSNYLTKNKLQLHSGLYNIFLTKEGEQTTSLINTTLAVDEQRQIKVHIANPPINKKMLEYVPFAKPFVCNQSDRKKLIKTSLLALAAFVTSQKFSDYTEKRDIYFSHKEEYEALRDVQQSVFDAKRSEMNSAYNKFNSVFSTLNYLYAGLGITYGYTIFF